MCLTVLPPQDRRLSYLPVLLSLTKLNLLKVRKIDILKRLIFLYNTWVIWFWNLWIKLAYSKNIIIAALKCFNFNLKFKNFKLHKIIKLYSQCLKRQCYKCLTNVAYLCELITCILFCVCICINPNNLLISVCVRHEFLFINSYLQINFNSFDFFLYKNDFYNIVLTISSCTSLIKTRSHWPYLERCKHHVKIYFIIL